MSSHDIIFNILDADDSLAGVRSLHQSYKPSRVGAKRTIDLRPVGVARVASVRRRSSQVT